MKHISILICILACLSINPAFLTAAENNSDIDMLKRTSRAFNQVAEAGVAAVVNIGTVKVVRSGQGRRGRSYHPFYDLFGDENFQRFFKQSSLGSGVLVSKKGYILTNNHVVQGADEITVTLSDKREFKAKIIGTDPKTDIALLKIKGNKLPTIQLGDSDLINVGDWAIAIGSPFGLAKSVTVGVISAKGRSNVGIVDYENFIQTDAAINQGNSGGALLNIDGEVVGINTAIFSQSGGSIGIGFAIPINMAKKVMHDLLEKGRVVRGWLGVHIQPISEELQKQFKLKNRNGVLISDLVNGGPADKAGLRRGDIITHYDGKPINEFTELKSMVAQTQIGKSIKLTIIRNKRTQHINTVIGALEDPKQVASKPVVNKLGMTVSEINSDLIKRYNLNSKEGLVVTEISPNGAAAKAGLREGTQLLEIDQRTIRSLGDYENRVKKLRKGNRVLFLVKTQGNTYYIVLTSN